MANSGLGKGSGSDGKLKWSFAINGSVAQSPAIGSDGTIYCSGYGHLYALKPDGSLKWSSQANNGVIITSLTLSQNGSILFGTAGDGLECFNSNGVFQWNFMPQNFGAIAAPTIGSDGTIYVGSIDGFVYALTPGGGLKWRYLTGSAIDSTPAIAPNGSIYVTSEDHKLYCLNTDGTLKWTFEANWEIKSSPAIGADGVAYFGTDLGHFYAIDLSGAKEWEYVSEGAQFSSPAIGPDGTIYVAESDPSLIAFRPSGAVKWNSPLYGSYSLTTPVVGGDGTIYISSSDPFYYAVNPDGSLLWKFENGDIFGDTAIGADGVIYVESMDSNFFVHRLIALGMGTGLGTVSNLSLSPTTVTGGLSSTGTVTLSKVAGAAGTVVSLSSSNASVTVPSTVTIASGSKVATFAITTKSVSNDVFAVITAALGASSATATLTVKAGMTFSLSLSKDSIVGGSQTLAVGTITASVSAPPAGYTFALSSSDNKLAPVPASVKIAGGATTVSFTIKHKSTASVSKITLKAARAGVTATKTLTLNPFQIQSFQVSPSSQVGGKTVSGLISLNDSVGTGNGPISIKLASSSTNAVVPSTSSVSAGKSTSSVTITTKPVALNTVAKVTASLGISSAESAVTLQAPTLLSVSVKPASVKGSASTVVTGTISLNSSAPAAGLVVSLSSSNSSAVSVPVTVKIPGGKSSVTFSVGHKKVMTQTAVLITAGLAGVSQSATLTVTP